MYRAVGAGPGPTVTYQVDMPWPGGRNSDVTIPIDALMADVWASAEPNVNAAITKGAVAVAASMALAIGLAALWIKRGR